MAEERKWRVYCWTNKVNGKRYVGMTKQTMNKRAGSHMRHYKDCPYFWSAIQKYGYENFECRILVYGLTLKEAEQKERNYIWRYRTRNPEYGYNIDEGGTHNQTEVTLLKQRQKTIEAHRKSKKMQAYRRTLAQHARDLHNDPNWREAASRGLKRMWQDPEERARRLVHINTMWKDPVKKQMMLEKRKATGKHCGPYKPVRVYCKETDTVYDEIKEAERALNVSIGSTRRRHAKKGQNTFMVGIRKNMHWTITVLPEEPASTGAI